MKKKYEELGQLIMLKVEWIHFVDELLSVVCINTDSVQAILNTDSV